MACRSQRLSYLPDGRVHYRLAKHWPTPAGVTELIMEPVQFLKRIAALIPPPLSKPDPVPRDGLECPSCQAQMLVIALITKPDVVCKILDHLRIPSTSPTVPPARQHPEDAQADLLDIDQDPGHQQEATAPVTGSQTARAPP